ncbi:hypothetical protein CC80DRAFT_510359 [Byssothecium circinans]|uniref:Rhodopsin domain-containing protein n=1 Tax=Byssothecium circinans TaxID=147558 RepID=A0A6A5TL12_9PLEO|nr:hypothetical protein CC80DRAFT_510359 [Byssothecium circinans]
MNVDLSNPPQGMDLDESRTTSNVVLVSVLFSLSALFVGLRLLTRLRYQRKPLGLDDYVMSAGLVLNAANMVCCLAGGYYGLGKHAWALSAYSMRKIGIIYFAFLFIYAWSVCVIKFSILIFYRRIFGMSWLGWWCIFLTTSYLLTHHIVLPLFAKPLSYYWDRAHGVEGEMRVNEAKVGIPFPSPILETDMMAQFILGMAIINMIGDICILFVPIRKVLALQLGKTHKLAVIVTFLLGSFVCFSSLYRIIVIVRYGSSVDMSWARSEVFIWSSVEPSVGIISGCLPTLRPLLTHILEKTGYKSGGSGSGRAGSEGGRHVETISKKRTRKIETREVFDETMGTQFEVDGDTDRYMNWRTDEESAAKHGNG